MLLVLVLELVLASLKVTRYRVFAFAVLLLGAALLPLQHCQRPMGTGASFDGKMFVHIRDRACPDGRNYDASLAGANGGFYLTRDACVDIPTDQQQTVVVEVGPANPSVLIYAERIFAEQLVQVATLLPSGGGYWADGTVEKGAFVGRFDDAGAVIWAKRVEALHESVLSRPLADGGALVLASSGEQSWITRLSPSGTVMWKKIFSGGLFYFRDMEVDPSGGVFLSGSVVVKAGKQVAVFARLDLNGVVTFARTFDFAGGGSESYLQFSPSGVLYMTGVLGGSPFIARLARDGSVAWMKVYAGWTAAALEFADDGAMIVKGRISRGGSGETFERYAELKDDGAVKVVVKLSEESWARHSEGRLYASGDGGFYTTLVLGADSFAVLRLRRDFSVDWGYRVPLQDELRFVRFERVTSGFVAVLTKSSKSDFLSPYDLAKIPSACSACKDVVAQTIGADELISVTEGPAMVTLRGFSTSDATPDVLTDVALRLPFSNLLK